MIKSKHIFKWLKLVLVTVAELWKYASFDWLFRKISTVQEVFCSCSEKNIISNLI